MSAGKLNTEIRQEQIARVALDLVSSQGLRKLNMAGVARRVGIVPSGLYRHFRNKDEILDSVLNLIRDLLHANVSKARKETPDPLEQLRRLLNLHVRLIRENEGIPRIIFSQDVYSSHPERKAKVGQTIMQYLHEVGEMVRQGQAGGQIKRELDPETIAMMFLGLIQPAAILWHLTDGGFDVTRHAERAWRIFRRAIGAKYFFCPICEILFTIKRQKGYGEHPGLQGSSPGGHEIKTGRLFLEAKKSKLFNSGKE